MEPLPITDAATYQAFWSYWLKMLVVLGSLWGAVLEGTLLSIRVAVEPRTPIAAPVEYVGGPSFGSTMVRADPASRALDSGASLMPIRFRAVRPCGGWRSSDR